MLLKVENISLAYDDLKVLNNLSFEVPQGQICCILGESGCGKTTLLKAIRGFMNRDSGEIYFNNERVFNKSEKLVPGTKGIAIVHQDFQLEPGFTVFDNIRHHLIKYTREFQEQRTQELIEICNLTAIQHKQSKELSGGQKQKVALAKALIEEPPMIILDEPFSNLDNISKAEFKSILKSIVKSLNITLLFVTHDSKDALTFSDQIVIIQKGSVLQKGSSSEIVRQPKNEYAARLLGLTNILNSSEFENLCEEPLKKDCKYWIPFRSLKITENGNHTPTEVECLGDEYLAFFQLQNAQLIVKSFGELSPSKSYTIKISNPILVG